MNLILTERCDKRCTFCFTPAVKKVMGEVMALEMVEALLDRFADAEFQLLGGEPTQHPQIDRVFELFAERGQRTSLVSNLLFDADMRALVLSHLDLLRERWILANAMELDRQGRLPRWRRNFLAFREHGFECKVALTITPQNLDSIVDVGRRLHDEVGYRTLRLGLDLLGNAGWVVNNRAIGQVFAAFDALGRERDFGFSSDCQVPPCVNDTVESWHSVPLCSSPPLDVFPDGSACYCYPLKYTFKHPNVLQLADTRALHTWFGNAYQERQLRRAMRGAFPDACYACGYFQQGACCVCLGALSRPPFERRSA